MNTPPPRSRTVWLLRIWAVVVLVSAFAVVSYIREESTAWFLKAAVTVVYVYSFVGAVMMFQGTLKADELRTPLLKQLTGVLWLLIVAAVGVLVMVYVF